MGRDVILWLDDSYERTALAYQRMPESERDNVIWCKTAAECISVLKDYAERLSKIYLDYNLSGNEETAIHPGNIESGMEIVRFLEDFDPDKFKGCLFIIHTWDIFNGKKMADRLLYAGYKAIQKPFEGKVE